MVSFMIMQVQNATIIIVPHFTCRLNGTERGPHIFSKKIPQKSKFSSEIRTHALSQQMLQLTIALILISNAVGLPLREIAHFPLNHPSMVFTTNKFPSTELKGETLLATSFSAFAADYIWAFPDILGQLENEGKVDPVMIGKHTTWPNEAKMVPEGAIKGLESKSILAAAGGFLVPGKGDGSIDLYDITDPSNPTMHRISSGSKWFYHRIVWADIDGDGLMDILTARASVDLIGRTTGELVWMKQPEENPLGQTWETTVMFEGPDVYFAFEDLDGDGLEEIIATEFFTSKSVTIYKCTKKFWSQCSGSDISSARIDDNKGTYFDVICVDLNNDAKIELLITSNRNDGKGGVFVYIPPSDIMTDQWTIHTLYDDFKIVKLHLPGIGAPGSPMTFRPLNSKGKLDIMVSGDDSGKVVHLTPISVSPYDWTYNATVIYQSTGTVGSIGSGDLDGDGIPEIIVPLYDEGVIQVYSMVVSDVE